MTRRGNRLNVGDGGEWAVKDKVKVVGLLNRVEKGGVYWYGEHPEKEADLGGTIKRLILAKLSFRWQSAIQVKMSDEQSEIQENWIVEKSSGSERQSLVPVSRCYWKL